MLQSLFMINLKLQNLYVDSRATLFCTFLLHEQLLSCIFLFSLSPIVNNKFFTNFMNSDFFRFDDPHSYIFSLNNLKFEELKVLVTLIDPLFDVAGRRKLDSLMRTGTLLVFGQKHMGLHTFWKQIGQNQIRTMST